MAKRLLVIEHVPHERLGNLEAGLTDAGCEIVWLRAHDAKAAWPALADVDGIVSMGGPQSVYQQGKYPYLTRELALLRSAIKQDKPILSVCLGAQLLAAALDAPVTKNHTKEIGWYPVMREPGANGDPMWDAFGQTETIFQWHGDTFALPKGAVQLASSPLCDQQAFCFGTQQYGLQFHVEVSEAMIRAWMQTPANKAELASLRGVIDPLAIRRQSSQHVPRIAELAKHVAGTFADLVCGSAGKVTKPISKTATAPRSSRAKR